MKTSRILLLIGGILNACFVLFHLLLGWQIHRLQMPPDLRSLLEMENGGGTLMILFLAVASLAFPAQVLGSSLGRLVLALAATLYVLRGAAEFVVSPTFHPAIFIVCLLTGLLYVGALVLAPRPTAPLVAA